ARLPASTKQGPAAPEFERAMAKANEALTVKQYAAAVEALTRALTLKPDDFDARMKRGKAFFSKGDYDQALADARDLTAQRPNSAPAFGLMGDALQWKREAEKALAAYSRAIDIDPKFA